MSFAKEVWETLSTLDVSKHTEKRGQFTYLSWAWAWAELMRHYPESTYHPIENLEYNNTLEVWMTVTIQDGEKRTSHTMWLPVMDFKNKAITNPDATDVNKARMRCLVKCLAMFGLGHYIYAGEDLPQQAEPELATEEQLASMKEFVEANQMSPRRIVWVKKNMDRMTQAQAATILKECAI